MRVKRSVSFSFSLFGPLNPDAIREVRRLDDEGVAFPAAARVAHVLANAGTDVRAAVERDDAGVVNHLVADDHFVWRLHDPETVAVEHREDPAHSARDAAIVEAEVLETVERAVAEGADAERLALSARVRPE